MPTYEYACSNCQNQWEEIQKISEPASTVCPKCNQSTARRQISGGNFILKGGGWYADLYSSTKKTEGSKTNGTSSNGDASKKADATPAASSSSNGSSGASSQSSSSGSGSGSGSSSGGSSSPSSGS
ncbi:zinc ribbon domain-containing protein [Pendulispora rubella]|uniref:Zinc ribbon domain-containing protein n=1 Tax=Pendulispora rubella TaxID=2741070 RepID=A0ABZ2LGM5_9BACT